MDLTVYSQEKFFNCVLKYSPYTILSFCIVFVVFPWLILFVSGKMPQTRGSCGHIRAAWDNHANCLSCAGCSQDNCCHFCVDWPEETWATKRRTFKSRKRDKRGSGQSRESSACRDFSPHDLDHMASGDAMHRSLPGDDTGQFFDRSVHRVPGDRPVDRSGDVTGHRSTLTGRVTGHAMTGDVTGHWSRRSLPKVKVGKVRLAVTFPHTTSTTWHQKMPCIVPYPVTMKIEAFP